MILRGSPPSPPTKGRRRNKFLPLLSQWFKQRVYKLEKEALYDASHFSPALEKAMEWGDRIPIGLFYRQERAVYEDSEPALQKGPLVDQELKVDREVFESLVGELV